MVAAQDTIRHAPAYAMRQLLPDMYQLPGVMCSVDPKIVNRQKK